MDDTFLVKEPLKIVFYQIHLRYTYHALCKSEKLRKSSPLYMH